MERMIPEGLEKKIEKAGIIAVLVINDAGKAVPLAKTLLNSGISAMELTLRTDAAIDSMKHIIEEVPGMTAGAGTVLSPGQITEVKAAGVEFAVAPGLNRNVMNAAADAGVPFAPGICVPSEIECGVEAGCRILKYFHAEGMGGVKYLKGINSPYGFLGLRYIPLGGLNIDNMRSYLEAPEVIALGGSWIAPAKLINSGDWDAIARNADAAVKILREVRG
ncbi:MAG: bifunctional 4-hydroxy-2-oxoglutarate aldolase/2-dehydro-3-deoxy-phosphogluconate aldolase [Spirochaetales bacterium]|uniref:2-dehydro-3-deoxy-phosphogluconate aldolase n=1 Tax=Candidatus Thalassospirochaeta sargassi TaxID=3119039 RepID=A0AAJ1IFL0_9SPIO|nr:bifunctional 4-hydroxy-2-oxoglutarate aldolase/2-dehydro-3-deoxy-phosphogluconate aldolase [Spirochaetales bacterium]